MTEAYFIEGVFVHVASPTGSSSH